MPLMSDSTTTNRRRVLVLAVVAATALLAGLLSPTSAQAATYGKPELSSVKAISGAGALKVSWKGVAKSSVYATTYRVWYGTSTSLSKASYKTVDLTKGGATRTPDGAVTAYNNNGSKTSPYYILTGISPKTTYNVWVQPWDTATNKASGPVSSRKSAKTSKYGYSAPVTITAVNANKTSVELTWRTVTGAPTYRVKAASSAGNVYRSSGAEGNMVVTGLKPNTSYTFTVSVEQPPVSGIPAYIKMSGESSAKAKTKTLSSSVKDAPTGLATRDDPTSEFDKNGQLPNSIALTWVAPVGFDPTVDRFRIDYATDQEMKTRKGYLDLVPDDGDGIVEKEFFPYPDFDADRRPGTGGDDQDQEPGGTGESTPPVPSQTPTPTVTPPTTPTPTPTPSVVEPTTEPTTASPTPDGDNPDADPSEEPSPDAEQLGAPIRPLAGNTTPVRYWGKVTGLASNENWYLRIKVLKKNAEGTWVVNSERTEALMGKTLSAKGYLTGRVVLPGTAKHSEYVVGAYRGTDLHDQATLRPDGTYQLSVREGSYHVKATYIGPKDYTDKWATASTDGTGPGGRDRTDPLGSAKSFKVTQAKGTTVNTIRPTAGLTISGDIDCPGAKSSQCSVDVAAMSDWGGTSKVIRTAQSNASGGYELHGLPPGNYNLRITHVEDRYKALTLKNVNITADRSGVDGSLSPRGWVKKYTTTISGTKRVGSTLKLSSKAWIASELPVVRAVPQCQWQRNGVNISGATKCSYKLTSADRGKSVRVKVHNFRYGFETNTSYSKSYRIS